jgi:hypothetical protein
MSHLSHGKWDTCREVIKRLCGWHVMHLHPHTNADVAQKTVEIPYTTDSRTQGDTFEYVHREEGVSSCRSCLLKLIV